MTKKKRKKHGAVVALTAKHSSLEIAKFLNLVRSFIYKIKKELSLTETFLPELR